MSGARLTPVPGSFYPCGLFGCMGEKGAYTLGRDGGHPDLYLCEHDVQSLIKTLPGELLPVVCEMITERLNANGGASKTLHDLLGHHFGGKAEPAPAGLPDVAVVVAEVQNMTEWGANLLQTLAAVLEGPGEPNPAFVVGEADLILPPASQSVVDGPDVTEPDGGTEPARVTENAAAVDAVAGVEDNPGHTVSEDGTVVCACGKGYTGDNALTNWKKHKPHCKGPKEGN